MGLTALIVPVGGSSQAQTVAEPAEVVSRTVGGGAYGDGGSRQSSISADGQVVEFDAVRGGAEVVVRQRVVGTVGPVSVIPSLNGSISDDGCVIAYTYRVPPGVVIRGKVPPASGESILVYAFNRCTFNNVLAGSAVIPPGSEPPRPKPNQDGSVIVWATPGSIGHSTRSGNTYIQGASITFPETLFGPDVSVSDDGNLVAFETSTQSIFVTDRRTPGSLEPISVDGGGRLLTSASDPSISGDGTLVAYTDVVSGVIVRDRANGANRAIAARAMSAEVSRDGRYVAYQLRVGEIGETFVARSTSNQPFATFETDLVSYRDGDPATGTGGSTSNPAISEHGRWVTFDSYAASLLVPGQGFDTSGTQVYVRQRRPIVTVDSINFGSVGGATDRQATIRSVGLAGFVITSIAASGDYQVVGHNCPGVLQPGASCVVTVRFLATGSGSKVGELAVRDDSYPGVPLVGTGRLVGVIDRKIPPPPTLPPPPGLAAIAITPIPVVFDDDVVVGATAPQQTATVTSIGGVAVTVQTLALSGAAAGDFAIVDDGCTGKSLTAGSTCEVDLTFTPSDAGSRVATLTVTGSGSTSASAELRGSGLFDAKLMVTPEVAAGGQVVTVVGSGFPPSTNVSIVLGADPPVVVATDAAGGFMLSWLVMSGTPQGELLADDVAVAGAYDAEPAPLQVVGTPMRPQATATLSRSGRSYVSR